MNIYEFTIVLADPKVFDGDSVLEIADRLFPYFRGDVSPAIAAGQPVIDCSVESPSLESAIRKVVGVLHKEGLRARRIELEAESIPAV